ncbi:MAG: helix-turn-helix transcriptional regulator [Burkholderiales bacterium]
MQHQAIPSPLRALPPTIDPLLRLPQVLRATGLSKSRVYDLAQKGKFPRPVKLSERTSAWRTSEIVRWIDERQSQQEAA